MQEYHNYIDLLGTQQQRQAFVADAFRLSPQWCWDWVEVDFNAAASSGGDSGKSHLDFYSRGFPPGLGELMSLHPEVVLDGHFFDISAPHLRNMKLHDNLVLEESDEEVIWEEIETVGLAPDGSPISQWTVLPHSPYFDRKHKSTST